MSFSAFSRFGHTGFSGKEQLGRTLYRSAMASLGPAYEQGFNDSHRTACIFADCMGLASAVWTLRRVRNNAIALKATDLLPALEPIYGLTPSPSDTLRRRRQRLHIRMLVARGGRREVVLEIMGLIFGPAFLEWFVADTDDLILSPPTEEEADSRANFTTPGRQAWVFRTTAAAFPGVSVVPVEQLVSPLNDDALVGRKVCVDPGSVSRREGSVVTAATASGGLVSSVTLELERAHDPGTVLTTQYFSLWRSTGQWHSFKLTEAAALDASLRAAAHEELRRTLKSVARWGLTTSGPFRVGEGMIGITEIG